MKKKQRPVPAVNCIKLYFHCSNCLPKKPREVSPAEWARLEAGWTEIGFQVRCVRCDLNIAHVDFQGQKHPANTSGRDVNADTTH